MSKVPALDQNLMGRINNAKTAIQSEFFNVDGVIERLEMFVAMNTILARSGNIIFYGKGGYGKSEMVAKFLELATGEKPYVVNMNQATTPSDIYGGVDIPSLANNGELNYNFDNSFMNHRWVIFEEGLEPRQKVLSALKYIITSGVFAAAGVQERPIHTLGIVIVTNIDTADFMESDDTKAFLERFPIQYKVGWEGLNQSQRFEASLKVVGKFDAGGQINYSQRRLIAENMATRMESPRTISRVVQALLARQSLSGGGNVSEQTFTSIMGMLGYGDKNLAAQIEQERIAAEINDAKQKYEQLFDALTRNMTHYQGLKSHINDPKYVIKLAKQIASTMRLIQEIKDSIVDIRTNPNYGSKGNELASWINAQVGGFSDQLDDIKMSSWDGILLTIESLVDKLDAAGVKI